MRDKSVRVSVRSGSWQLCYFSVCVLPQYAREGEGKREQENGEGNSQLYISLRIPLHWEEEKKTVEKSSFNIIILPGVGC